MNESRIGTLLASAVALLLLLVTGCAKSLPPETDADVARSGLTAALDAWKAGQTPETLQTRMPPVDFRDINWDKGSQLSNYVVKSEERSGMSVRFTVQLSLKQKDGASGERVVMYNVDAGKSVVIRPDF